MDAAFSISAASAAAAGTAAGTAAALAYLHQVQTSTPTEAATVVFTDDDKDRTLFMTPAGALLVLGVTFPTDGNSRLGQQVCVGSTQAISAVTFGGATVLGTLTTLVAGISYSFRKVAADTWIWEL